MKVEDLKNQQLDEFERKCIENSVQPWAKFRAKMEAYIAESDNIVQLRTRILDDSDMKWSQIYSEASKRTEGHAVRMKQMLQGCDRYACNGEENGRFSICGQGMGLDLYAGDSFMLIGVNNSQPSMANMFSCSSTVTVWGSFQVCGMNLDGMYDVYTENGYVLFEKLHR